MRRLPLSTFAALVCGAQLATAQNSSTPPPTLAPLPKPEVNPKPGAVAEPEPKVEIRPAKPKDETPRVQIRPANLKNTKTADAMTLGPKEQKIVSSLKTLTTEQLHEFAELYNRMGNGLMTGVLVAEMTRRDPKDAMIESIKADAASGGVEHEDDPEATKAQDLYMSGKVAEAAALLLKLKADKFKGKPFPYQQDLAYSLLESGQEEKAKEAFSELLSSTTSTKEEKVDAGRSLASIALEALQAKGQAALTSKDARRAMEVANQLLAKNPNDPDGIALKAEALSLTGRNAEAVSFLMDLKLKAGPGPFIHQKALADALYDARNFDAAEAAYREVVDDKKYPAEDRQECAERLQDLKRDRLIAQGEAALNRRNVARAEEIATQLESEKPVHPDSRAFRAQILTRQNRFEEALAILNSLQGDPKHPFEANAELGEALMNTGRWKDAAERFSIAENDQKLADSERFDAGRLGRELRARYRPTLSSVYEAESGAEGSVWRHSTEASTGVIGEGNILVVRSAWDQIHLSSARSVNRQDAERFQAELAYRRLISNGFFGEVSVGGSDNDVVYGGKIGRYEKPGTGWELSYRGNDRATDSLALESMNGRQNILALYLSTHLSRRFYLDARVFFRQVNVRDIELGTGWGVDMNFGYTLLEETRRRPEFQISYFNEINYFNGKNLSPNFTERYARKTFTGNLEGELIDQGINRHGVVLTLSKQLGPKVNAYIYGGVSYEFETGEPEGRAGAGIEAHLAPNTTLNIGVDYTTSGNAGNQGSDVLSGSVGVKMSF